MLKISKYVLYDIIKNRVMIGYTAFLFIVSISMFQMEENSSKAMLSLLNIVLIVVPLISMIFSTIHWYNSYEFIELMLTQPISRKKVILSEYTGISSSLVTAFLIGVGIPVCIYNFNDTGVSLLLIGSLLTLIFTSLAFLASVKSKDKARGIGAALLLWFYFALIYDGLVLLILFAFSDYPLEKITLVLSSLNPVDLGRIFIMLNMDISALMGYTGAMYKDFLGSSSGMIYTLGILIIWMLVPLTIAIRSFNKKDL
ncbi:ABC transporter permease subunit [Flavisolibacter ginsengisoli]|jgi:Cu-processing system permease protein|uniref:Cu-processing system permease protein n=1 Tax=Flavisolibacter ginsengisoli DSM 18119 TaxID=1121884 RepID=A0A1M5CNK9_9BACT|nr:ABC transporter permease subunit [Flavisolibacter ginsengisoli]SHF56246.1 Cu-processing system permease protein [Flavisolibacter ginsengisoli DSM 18119]